MPQKTRAERPTTYISFWEFSLRYPRDFNAIHREFCQFVRDIESRYAIQADMPFMLVKPKRPKPEQEDAKATS